jgi:hypothetical protein
MTQTTNTDRDAINPQALAEAITVWRCDRSDEADIALEAALLEQGIITPDEAIEQIEAVRNGSSEIIGLFIRLESDEMFTIDRDGQIHAA